MSGIPLLTDRAEVMTKNSGSFEADAESRELEEKVVKIYRCATVVRGGRRFSFGSLVVIGDRDGHVGVGYGKANEVPGSVEKGKKIAESNMMPVK